MHEARNKQNSLKRVVYRHHCFSKRFICFLNATNVRLFYLTEVENRKYCLCNNFMAEILHMPPVCGHNPVCSALLNGIKSESDVPAYTDSISDDLSVAGGSFGHLTTNPAFPGIENEMTASHQDSASPKSNDSTIGVRPNSVSTSPPHPSVMSQYDGSQGRGKLPIYPYTTGFPPLVQSNYSASPPWPTFSASCNPTLQPYRYCDLPPANHRLSNDHIPPIMPHSFGTTLSDRPSRGNRNRSGRRQSTGGMKASPSESSRSKPVGLASYLFSIRYI